MPVLLGLYVGEEGLQVNDSPACPAVDVDSFLVTGLHVFRRAVPRQETLFQPMNGLDKWDAKLEARVGHKVNRLAKLRDDRLLAFLDDVSHEIS